MKFRSLALVFALIAAAPQHLSAQGFFQAFGIPKTATATGQTEVLGSIQIGLQQGTVAADTLVIDVSPLVITNASASDILVTDAGNLVTGTVTIDTTAQHVNVPVNAGATNGSLRIDGIRVALAGTNSSSVTARLSWANHANFLQTTSVTLVNSVQTALVTQPMTDLFHIFNNTVLDNTATINLQEGYAGAFVSGTQYGENTSTQIRIQVTDFPSGLQMTFPASITAKETTATLTTSGGGSITLPRSDGTTTVTYVYSGATDSAANTESFNIPFTVSVQGTVQDLQPTISVSLAPIGAATPSTALPSTSVPRYAEDEEDALAGTSQIVTQTLYWPGINSALTNRVSLMNPGSYMSNVTLTAMDQNGALVTATGIANPLTESLGPNQSLDAMLSDLFGNAAAGIATLKIDSTGPNIIGLGTASSSTGTASITLSSDSYESFSLPVLQTGGSITLFNPGGQTATGTLTLLAASGAVQGSKTVSVNPAAQTVVSIQDAFGSQTSGQIVGSFQAPLIALESAGSDGNFNLVAAQIPSEVPSLYVPLVASGGGYETDLSLTNATTSTISMNVQLSDSGSTTGGGAQSITLAPSQQTEQTASQLFGSQNGSNAGYVQIQPAQIGLGPFNSYPRIAGFARIHSGQATAAVPTFGNPQLNLFILSSGVPSDQYQGLSVINPNAAMAHITFQVLSPTGTVVETASLTLASGQVSAKLTSELFSTAVPEKSVIRVSSDVPVIAASAFGTLANDQIRIVLGQ